MLSNLHLIEQYNVVTSGKVLEAYKFVLERTENIDGRLPSEQVSLLWETYCRDYPHRENNLNGKLFEAVLATILLNNGVSPIFVQAKVVFVPNVNFDFIVYSKELGPIAISAKTSLRERYKQADLESVSLKYVHRKARCFLVTMDKEEAARLERKRINGDLLGIDEIVLGDEESFNGMVAFLSNLNLEEPAPVEIVKASKILR
ncbi:hypothetical protein F4U02_14550 [Acinetobacter haemolyticus]|uniref:hypothetical protein n=1 Tax=Acinetobacter haemolyticus TaxID=29430 RepID=UPI001298610D|nr:hypothetical protein [Acinetobacter haemolyticus]MQZ32201.1 hypothetical protein [Acinetobacter haemolyticus]